MVLAGGYAIWYGRWELAVYDGDLGTDPVIAAMEGVRLWFVEIIPRIGAERLAVLAVVVVGAVVAGTRFANESDRSPNDDLNRTSADVEVQS